MEIIAILRQAVLAALKSLDITTTPERIVFEHPGDLAHGDYSTNIAMVLAKEQKVAPKVLAEKIVAALAADTTLAASVAKIEVAGPGFINIHLTQAFFVKSIETILATENFGANTTLAGKRVMIEYTQPNPFKPFHIGHLMSNSIGESLSRLIQYSGANTVRVNYQGDVGPHVAKAIWGINKKGKPDAALSVAAQAQYIGECYSFGAQAYENDPTAKAEIDAINKKIYDKTDAEINAVYDWGKRLTLDAFELIYKKLGTKFAKYFFESDTAPIGLTVVKENVGKVFEESEGAIVFHAEKYNPSLHTRVFINSQGLPTYETKEIGLTKTKFENDKPDLSIVITAVEQDQYMRVVVQALALINKDWAAQMRHVTHGMMRFTTGKMSSRKGNVITGESLLTEMEQEVATKMADRDLSTEQKQIIAAQVAVAAIKYTILRQATGKDIIFDPEKSISFEGDSGPYLQYAHTRAASLLEKAHAANIKPSIAKPDETVSVLEKMLYRFPEIVHRSAAEYAPNHVATYLIELSAAFNSYYSANKIVDAADPQSPYRVALTLAVKKVLAEGLYLLGIAVPEKM